jgi:sorting nexin-25
MEFMDRRNRSLLVQFWLTVESFKNPLESVESGSSGDEDEPMQDSSSSTTLKEDISMINDLYFAGPSHPALSSITKKHVDIICSFARDEMMPSPSIQRRVRRSVMLAQRQVERDMEQDFDDFERSELWFRAIGDTEFGHRKPIIDGSKDKYPAFNPTASVPQPTSATRLEQGPAPQISSPPEPSLVPSVSFPRTNSSGSNVSFNAVPPGVIPGPRGSPFNIQVLMSPVSDASSQLSRAPLFGDPDEEADQAQIQRMEAIQAALTDIIAFEQEHPRNTPEGDRVDNQYNVFHSPHTGHPKQRVDFHENMDEDADMDADDDRPEESSNGAQGSFQLAAPGDLQLSYEIARLGDNIASLQAQDVMLGNLIKKAELTGDTQELKLLKRSKSSMNRELRELKFQKLQYEQQEAANRLVSDRTKVAMVSSTVRQEDGKSVVRYLIEVQQLAPDGSFASGWVVARRYNEFLDMHNKLRDRYGLVRNLDFPGKRIVTALSGSFLDTRRQALEKYLQVRSTILSPVPRRNIYSSELNCHTNCLRK